MSNTRVHSIEAFRPPYVFTTAGGGLHRKRIKNPYGKGCVVAITVTAHNGGTLNAKLVYVDPVSGNTVDIPGAAFAAIAGSNQTVVLYFFPGIAVVANSKVDGVLPGTFELQVTATVADVTGHAYVDILP